MEKALNADYLEATVYPVIRAALAEFLEILRDSDELRAYGEHARKQRLIDEREIESAEKKRLKKQLGSAYLSSDSEGEGGRVQSAFDLAQDDVPFKDSSMKKQRPSSAGLSASLIEDSEGMNVALATNPLKVFVDLLEKHHQIIQSNEHSRSN